MNEYVLSLNKNVLKLSLTNKTGLHTKELEIPQEVVKDSDIVDVTAFGEIIKQTALDLSQEPKIKGTLTYISEPDDVILNFVVVNKSNGNIDELIVSEVKNKLEGVDLEKLYFSYHKIAPFVYQFIGVKKQYLENILQAVDLSGLSLKSIIPWIMLLPRYVNTNDPAIFTSRNDSENLIIALSELQGIFFMGMYQENISMDSLQKLIYNLSVYKRQKPISLIYNFRAGQLDVTSEYQVVNIDVPNSDLINAQGFEKNLLVNYMLDSDDSLVNSHLNLLSLLPLPEVVVTTKKALSIPVKAGALVAVSLIIVGLFFFKDKLSIFSGNSQGQETNQEVLSQNDSQTEGSQDNTTQEQNQNLPIIQEELKKDELRIRVENGAGISGAAKNVQDYLLGIGYQVPEIDTADELRDSTLLRFNTDKMKYKDLVIDDIKSKSSNLVIEENLPADTGYDLLIILGGDVNL